ncbi:Uncharacterised protein [Vibrio cholerae]|uniref:Uncharacterized protein n=1 Tax=Vibrio cholerae TaxID=666 RepID=A0A655PYV8_VIBCL|nr:Uncharacterised protein [Vibrio cholerae]CSA30363.1 Uncharacterised protein [Vibrio cholerae]
MRFRLLSTPMNGERFQAGSANKVGSPPIPLTLARKNTQHSLLSVGWLGKSGGKKSLWF